MRSVNWSAYAKQYDLMAEINPAYQELLSHCIKSVEEWHLADGSVVADLCAGTGNFSVAIARALPAITVLHVELNQAMLAAAVAKAKRFGLSNWRPVQVDLTSDTWSLPKLAGVVAVHCIYTFRNPKRFIAQLCSHLDAPGFVYACDLGRVMSVYDWACYLFRCSLTFRGLLPTLALLGRTNLVRRQNQLIAAAQRSGLFWTHDLDQFRVCFEQAGISVSVASGLMYRGYDDLIIGRKRPACFRSG